MPNEQAGPTTATNLLRVGQMEHSSRIYGPGNRTVVWTQGCTLACPGCWNEDLWSRRGGQEMGAATIVRAALEHGDEGLTLLGGEPLQQASATLDLIRLAASEGLGIFLYTGYEVSEVGGDALECIKAADIVVAGRYVEALRDTTLRWRGSTNQSVLFNTSRYAADAATFEEGTDIEIHMDEGGRLTVLGYPDAALLEDLLDADLSADERGRTGPSSQPPSGSL